MHKIVTVGGGDLGLWPHLIFVAGLCLQLI